MWRVILFLVAVLAAAMLAILVVQQNGVVSLTLGQNVYETSLGVALGALLVAVAALYLAWRILKLLLLLPFSAFALGRSRRRAKADQAISRGLVAAASGDLVAAARHAQAAERLAGHEPLALLLKAQAAQLHGDRKAAKEAFARMTRVAATRGLGLRGLFVEARRRGDGAEASRHAAQAAQLDVFLPWAHEANLLAQCRARDWPAALATLERNHRLGAMPAGEMRRAKAALLAARAIDLSRSEPREALQAALRALGIDPGLTPAATTAASLLAKEGRARKATRIIEAAWRASPHPDLAAAYLALEPHAAAADRLRQMRKLAALAPEHEESRYALARSLLAGREFAQARATLAPLAEGRPTARICLLLAEIEEAENGMTGLAREWLARAAHAPRDPAWIAEGTVMPQWAPVELESGRIGVFAWAHPPELVTGPTPPARLPIAPPREPLPPPRQALPAAEVVDPAPTQPPPQSVAPQPPPAAAAAPAAPASAGAPPAQPADIVASAPQSARIETVAFPLERAPDDPGTERPKGKGLWQRLTQ